MRVETNRQFTILGNRMGENKRNLEEQNEC